jgi:hypothetical protein
MKDSDGAELLCYLPGALNVNLQVHNYFFVLILFNILLK